MTAIPDELELQRIYDLSKQEAKIYRMRLEGMRMTEIADNMASTQQYVKNTMVSVKRKIKEKEHPMQIIAVDQPNNRLMMKCTAELCLRILQNDQQLSGFNKGKFTTSLDGIEPNAGDTEFMKNEVFRYIEPRANNEAEVVPKLEAILKMYQEKGGERGKMGYGFVIWVFERYHIPYDII